ncbi:MAG TPA: Ger(x)C family spore germination protein [Bacillales bacterium]|nr:Ger(x)C family spore germination protein [Bacillales bacterium]
MKKTYAMILFSALVLLTGCWDQRYFKDVKLGMASSMDVAAGGKMRLTVSIPTVQKFAQGLGTEKIQIVSTVASTPRKARMKIDRIVAKNFDAAKMRVFLIGEKMAKKGIYPLLDVLYRDPSNPLDAKIAVMKGKGQAGINLSPPGESRISEYLRDLLDSAERSTLLPKGNDIQAVSGNLVGKGKDDVLPYLVLNQQKGIITVSGVALFNRDYYTGKHLTPEQATLLILMSGKHGRIARITKKMYDFNKQPVKNFITIDVKKVKSNLQLKVESPTDISAFLNMTLVVRTVEFPIDHLHSKNIVEQLNEKLSKKITKDANQVISKLQEANCDYFGLGRQMIAFHPDIWNQIDWNKRYPKIDFKSKVRVNIVQHGIID